MSSIWQKAGLLTWTDSFDAQIQTIATTMFLALFSVAANVVAVFSLTSALIIVAILLVLALWMQYRDMPLIVGKRMNIPNVIAIRKSPQAPRRRVVMIAPLDTSAVVDRFNRPWHHVVVIAVQGALLLVTLHDPVPLVY